MATKIYLVRHAKPDLSIHDDFLRPLSSQGLMERKKVTDFLMDKNILRYILAHTNEQLTQ